MGNFFSILIESVSQMKGKILTPKSVSQTCFFKICHLEMLFILLLRGVGGRRDFVKQEEADQTMLQENVYSFVSLILQF